MVCVVILLASSSFLFTSLSLASTIEITFSSTSRTTAGCRQLLLMALMTDFWSSSIFAVVVIFITLSAIGEPEYSGRG